MMTVNADSLGPAVLSKLEGVGFKGRLVSVEHLRDLRDEIERFHFQGLFDEGVYRDYSQAFNFEVPEALPQACSIIVVASPVPVEQVTFTVNGRPFRTIIPSTYNVSTDQQAADCITDVLKPRGYQLVTAPVPRKLLATCSGLAKYGKNNITYVEGMGSHHRLTAFYIDAPMSEDHWQKPDMLDRCKTCTACVKKCPSGAMSSDRFLLHAEKCITYHNESDKPFPEWIDPF